MDNMTNPSTKREENTTPCDYPDENGVFHCPYEGMGSESEMCRNFCGLGVDE